MGRTVTLSLGKLQEKVEARVQSGAYASASEVVRAGLRALEREEAVIDDWMREKIRMSLDDPRPSVPATEAFARLRARQEEMLKADRA